MTKQERISRLEAFSRSIHSQARSRTRNELDEIISQIEPAAVATMPGGAGKALAGRMILPALAVLGTGAGAYYGTKEMMDYFNDGDYQKSANKTADKVAPDYKDSAGGGKAGLRYKTEQVARIRGVDPNTAKALIHAESNFNPNAVSHAGARGLAQVMPFHFKPGEDPFNPDVNLNRGLSYYKEQLTKYKGDERKALAAYNSGPGAVDARVKKYGEDWLQHMPAETRAYVPRVQALKRVYEGTPSEETLERSPLKLKTLGGQKGIQDSIDKRTGKYKTDKKQAPDGPAVDRGFEIMQGLRDTSVPSSALLLTKPREVQPDKGKKPEPIIKDQFGKKPEPIIKDQFGITDARPEAPTSPMFQVEKPAKVTENQTVQPQQPTVTTDQRMLSVLEKIEQNTQRQQKPIPTAIAPAPR